MESHPLSFSEKCSVVLAKNREVMILRRDASESASGDQKKDDAFHTTAGLAPVD